jgi:aldehyde dehydrogenase (NAD+)
MNNHSQEHIDAAFERLKALSLLPPTSSSDRKSLLKSLRRELRASKDEIRQAVYDDFEKSSQEAELTEIATVFLELDTAVSNVPGWMSPRRVRAFFPFWLTRSFVSPQPKGVVLIVSPWNYPVLLSLAPVISAIAAGNRVILKPSERTPHTSAMLEGLIERALGSDWCVVIQGDASVGAHLLTKPFDHFFFTGSPPVGRIVMKAAADHWSSVTLELGGKSPAIVDETADIKLATEKIIVGKYLNAGQTCIAPDFVLAHDLVFDRVVEGLVREAENIKKENTAPVTGIVDERHAQQLLGLWEDARKEGAVLHNGEEPDLRNVSIITGVPIWSKIMREEIFGPLLPVLRFSAIEDILGIMRGMGEPLTTYLFTTNSIFSKEIRSRVKTGSICQNEVLLHFGHPGLPFGGFGKSGLGRTHGHSGFNVFSNSLSVMEQRWGRGVLPLLFPVKGSTQEQVRRWLLKYFKG